MNLLMTLEESDSRPKIHRLFEQALVRSLSSLEHQMGTGTTLRQGTPSAGMTKPDIRN